MLATLRSTHSHWVALLIALSIAPTAAAKPLAWSQFRGPAGSGIADEEHPPIEVGQEKNFAWKVAAPNGMSSPIVVGDLLVLTSFEDGKLSFRIRLPPALVRVNQLESIRKPTELSCSFDQRLNL